MNEQREELLRILDEAAGAVASGQTLTGARLIIKARELAKRILTAEPPPEEK